MAKCSRAVAHEGQLTHGAVDAPPNVIQNTVVAPSATARAAANAFAEYVASSCTPVAPASIRESADVPASSGRWHLHTHRARPARDRARRGNRTPRTSFDERVPRRWRGGARAACRRDDRGTNSCADEFPCRFQQCAVPMRDRPRFRLVPARRRSDWAPGTSPRSIRSANSEPGVHLIPGSRAERCCRVESNCAP